MYKAVNSFCYDTSDEKEPGDSWTFVENKRRYARTDNDYLCPVDGAEKDRMDIFHAVFNKIRHDHLHSVPINHAPGRPSRVVASQDQSLMPGSTRKPVQCPRGPNILDIGTGTGIWALMMARQYPEGIVLGLDRFWYLQPQV
ncbi:hypothetical protein BROUX41_000677 [Berkeleyomyces rouxiae]|uniref:uncharacterized protein n=1 Tax=Berkeleyomyces rouxiae TaxID=2035830 RepID=UPI003B7EDE5D